MGLEFSFYFCLSVSLKTVPLFIFTRILSRIGDMDTIYTKDPPGGDLAVQEPHDGLLRSLQPSLDLRNVCSSRKYRPRVPGTSPRSLH